MSIKRHFDDLRLDARRRVNKLRSVWKSRANSEHSSASGDGGFTLIELLVVLSILALLAGLTAPRVIGYLGGARSQAAEVQLRTLTTALDLFHLEVGRYPSDQEGLEALFARPSSVSRWNGPYVTRADDLQDPWDKPYQYKYPGEHGPYDVTSFGADGLPGGDGEDRDIVSW